MNFIKKNVRWLLPLIAAFIIAPFTPWLDMATAHLCYQNAAGFSSNAFLDFLYTFGELPAQLIGIVATLYFLHAVYARKRTQQRFVALILSLNMIIGYGSITRTVLKELWGRPRPIQIEEFGGTHKFRPFYTPILKKGSDALQSFPSGHAACGFYFFSLYFIGYSYQKRWLKNLGLALGATLGVLLSFVRIVQGGHFLSDTLFSALIMWETACFVDFLIFESDCFYFHPKTSR